MRMRYPKVPDLRTRGARVAEVVGRVLSAAWWWLVFLGTVAFLAVREWVIWR